MQDAGVVNRTGELFRYDVAINGGECRLAKFNDV